MCQKFRLRINITLAPARKEQHECGLSRDLLAMTSHNCGGAQGRLISPRSASGGLRRGRFPALRSGPIPHLELCDVMPSPKRGQVPRQAAKHAACAAGSRTPLHRGVSSSSQAPAGDPPPCCGRPENMSCSMLCPASRCSHRVGMGRSHRASPCGPDHAGCWPGERGRRPPAFAGSLWPRRSKQVSGSTRGPRNRRACAHRRKGSCRRAHCRAG
jgi:hypothetical protein